MTDAGVVHAIQQSLRDGVFVDPETDNLIVKIPDERFIRLFASARDLQVDGKAILWSEFWLAGLMPSQIAQLVYERKREERQVWITVIPRKESQCATSSSTGSQEASQSPTAEEKAE